MEPMGGEMTNSDISLTDLKAATKVIDEYKDLAGSIDELQSLIFQQIGRLYYKESK